MRKQESIFRLEAWQFEFMKWLKANGKALSYSDLVARLLTAHAKRFPAWPPAYAAIQAAERAALIKEARRTSAEEAK